MNSDRAHPPTEDRATRASPEPLSTQGLGHPASVPCAGLVKRVAEIIATEHGHCGEFLAKQVASILPDELPLEKLGEALFNLSDSIRKHGCLADEEFAQRYEVVVAEFRAISRLKEPPSQGYGEDAEAWNTRTSSYQRGRLEAIEEAAKLIEADNFVSGDHGLHIRQFDSVGKWLNAVRAAAIRSLASEGEK